MLGLTFGFVHAIDLGMKSISEYYSNNTPAFIGGVLVGAVAVFLVVIALATGPDTEETLRKKLAIKKLERELKQYDTP